jgi:hypothetical protein
MVHPEGEKRRCQARTLRRRYGGRLPRPVCQKANIDFESTPGEDGDVRADGRPWRRSTGGAKVEFNVVPGI